jgi:hypothetical protein
MNDYYIRCTQAKVPELLKLAVMVGILKQPEAGVYYPASPQIVWVPLGTLYKSSANPEIAPEPRLAPDGKPWFHANLRVPFDSLLDYVQGVYAANPSPELGAAIASIGDFFLLNQDGTQAVPGNPAVVFA